MHTNTLLETHVLRAHRTLDPLQPRVNEWLWLSRACAQPHARTHTPDSPGTKTGSRAVHSLNYQPHSLTKGHVFPERDMYLNNKHNMWVWSIWHVELIFIATNLSHIKHTIKTHKQKVTVRKEAVNVVKFTSPWWWTYPLGDELISGNVRI